ncbi:MAG: hypothetical protein LQ340_002164 [Diploschistes diacapsis]|nr:MAG: hypothetical protein LQ340_002164 [Diploschistes diacapsis]
MQINAYSFILAALVALASAASGPNAFNVPPQGYLLHAGQAQTFTWDNLQGSTVTLMLREGPDGNLNQGTVLASGLQNTGTYTWSVPANTVEGNAYTIEIIDEQDPTQTNFTPQFDILSNVLASSSQAPASTAAPSTSFAAPASTAPPTTSLPASTAVASTSSTSASMSMSSSVTASGMSTMASSMSTSGSASGSSTQASSASSTNPAPSTVALGAAGRSVVLSAGTGVLAVAVALVGMF